MEFSQPEVKIINQSTWFVKQWRWYKYVLVAVLLSLIYFCYFLISSDIYGKFAGLIGVPVGLILGYLLRNWSTPKKEALLLRLVSNKKTPNKNIMLGILLAEKALLKSPYVRR